MKFREHRGGLAESMRTCVDLETKEAFLTHMRRVVQPFVENGAFTLAFKPYGYDDRIGWDTVLVVLEGHCPIGMMNAPPPKDWFGHGIKFEYSTEKIRLDNKKN
jgi:hypothetical protein